MNQKIHFRFFLAVLFFAALSGPVILYASELVNINTADQASLETLGGIGPSKAQAIITYRTQNGPFAAIEDIMNVSGIGTATFNNIKDYITVGGSGSTAQTTASSTSTQTQTQVQSQNQASGAGPPTITVLMATDSRVTAGGGSYFSASAYGAQNAPIPNNVRFMWNFGDGAAAEGARVFHVFSYPGRYAVSVTAAYNYSVGIDRIVVEAVNAPVLLDAKGDGSLLIQNKSSKEINIGLWSLSDYGKSYVIPENTFILAGEGVRFSSSITGLSGSPTASLLYQNGTLAAAASVSADSPLRGERVTAVAAQKQVAVKEQKGEVLGTSTVLPQAQEKDSSSLWLSLGALVVLLAGGAWAVHYLGLSYKSTETIAYSGEFDIEE